MRGFIIFIVVLLLALAGLATWFFFRSNSAEGALWRGVPPSASVVVKAQGLGSLLSQWVESPFWQELRKDEQLGQVHERLQVLDSLLAEHPQAGQLWLNGPALVSLHNLSVDELGLLFLLPEKAASARELQQFLEEVATDGIDYTAHTFAGVEIQQAFMGGRSLSWAYVNGVLALSEHPLLVEDAVRTLHTEQLKPVLLYQELQALKPAEVLVNYAHLDGLLSPLVEQEVLPVARSFTGIARYDWLLADQLLTLYGNLRMPQESNLYIGQRPDVVNIPHLLPMRTAFFELHSVEEFMPWFDAQAKADESLEVQLRDFTRTYQWAPEQQLLQHVSTEWALAITEPPTEDFSSSVLGVISLQEPETVIKNLRQLNTNVQEELVTYRNYIFERHEAPLFSLLFGEAWQDLDTAWYTLHEHYLIVASSRNNLQRVLDRIKAGQTLTKDPDYYQFAENLLTRCNYYLFVNGSRAMMLPQQFLKSKMQQRYQELYPHLENFRFLAFQLSAEAAGYYNHLAVQFGKSVATPAEVVWQTALEAPLATQPQVVYNHYTGARELLVADLAGRLYLLSASGTVLWKEAMEGILVGRAEQVDLYKNEKLQYLFTTPNHIQLIDRLGRDVANYPIRLPAPTRTGAAVFDLFDNKNYRYYVGTENNRIYGYEADGHPLSGWSGQVLDAPLQYPLQATEVKGKWYLYGITRKGTFYVFTLEGRLAARQEAGTEFIGKPHLLAGNELATTYAVTADTAGTLYSFSFAGELEKTPFLQQENLRSMHAVEGLPGGGQEFLFAAPYQMVALGPDSIVDFALTLNESLLYPPIPVSVEGTFEVAYVTAANQAYVTASDGVPLEGFPVPASTPIALQNLVGGPEPELIVGNEEGELRVIKIH